MIYWPCALQGLAFLLSTEYHLYMQQKITRALNRYSPLLYLFAISSFITGFCFTFLQFLPDIQNTLLFKYGVFFDLKLWAIILLIGMSVLLLGLATGTNVLIRIGSFSGFMLWLFVSITYTIHHFYYALIISALLHVLAHGFIYLRSSQKRLDEL